MNAEETYLDFLLTGAIKADNYWHDCLESGEVYCYGRNNVHLNLMYAEEERMRLKLQFSWVPTEIWQAANRICGGLLKV
jgi:hypothetical protein